MPLRYRRPLTPEIARAESVDDLGSRLLLARSLVVFGKNPKTRAEAMAAVDTIRNELLRRGLPA
jgi:hypothetical protein